MKKHPLILRCLIVLLALTLLPMFPVSEGNVLSFLSLGGTPAIAESLSVSVTLSGMNCNFTVNNAVSPTTWCQLLDSEGNILSSWDYSSTEGGMNFPINTPGEYRYYVIVIDSATGERASAYTPYFTFAKCSHPTTIKTNEKKVYWEKNDSSHSIVLIYTPECTVCYKTLDPEEEIIGSGYHRFNNNGVCRDCDYCSHEEVRKEYTGESTVVNKNHYYYHYIETPYKVYCSYCNEHLKDGVESIEEVHQFSGYCFCGYYSCPHENRTYRYIGVEYGIDGLSNEKQHHVGKFYELYCYDCEEVVVNGYMNSENPNLYKTYWEDHTFDSNGECIYCHDINPDYSPEAPVPPADLQVAVGMNTTAAFKGDKLTATASVSGGSGKYACDWVITCNGAVVEMTAFDPGLTYVYYANQTGNWKFTAYVTDKENSNLKTVSASGPVVTVTECTHENTTTESIGNPSYKQLNDQQHTVIETVKDVCSNCGAVVKDEYTVTQPENHAFNKENKCTLCGYVVPDETCKHTKTKEVTQTTYNENGICDNDPDRHYRTVYKKRVCSDCKEVIENSETTNSKYENHNFDAAGKCVCGYIKKTEETYEKLAVDIETWHNDAAFSESTKTISIGSTAKIVGGSGDYTCEWTATSNNGKSAKKTITTKDAKVSWAINVYEPDTWHFTITVTDNKTGERVSASDIFFVVPYFFSSYTTISERNQYLTLLRQYGKYDNPLKDTNIYNMAYNHLSQHFSSERTKELLQIAFDAPPNYQIVFLYTLFDYDILSTTSIKESKYDEFVNGIYFQHSDAYYNDETVFHEIGHAIDCVFTISLEYEEDRANDYIYSHLKKIDGVSLRDYIIEDVENNMMNRMMDHGINETSAKRIAKSITSGSTLGLSAEEMKERKKVPGYYNKDSEIGIVFVNGEYGNVSDIYGGATGNFVLGQHAIFSPGHETSYWNKREEQLAMEFWANYFSANMRNDQEELSALHKMLPQACEAMDSMIEFYAGALLSIK